MSATFAITGRVAAAGRALAGISLADFAEAAGLAPDILASIERGGSAWVHPSERLEAMRRAFDLFGIVVISESDGMGAGVRLKLTRQDVRQITRLEGEGGIVGADDAP